MAIKSWPAILASQSAYAGVCEASEEILASLLRAMICNEDTDRLTLYAKATAELLDCGQNAETAIRQLQELWELLEALL